MPAFLLASLAGALAHSGLMYLKHRFGMLPQFEPYDALQQLLANALGASVPRWAALLLTYLNGSVVVGFAFKQSYRLLPGESGSAKGLVFGLCAWVVMGVAFFPALGFGWFGLSSGGLAVPAFSLVMLLVYCVTMGIAHSLLSPRAKPKPRG